MAGPNIAVVGGGPAGKAAARELREAGIIVTIFEKEQALGGLMRYGYPSFRMPDEITDRDNAKLAETGIVVRTGQALGENLTIASLEREFDATILALGASKPIHLGVPGEDLPGVFPALELLYAARADQAPALGERVLVIGGGDTAVDAATTAKHAGARESVIAYRGDPDRRRTLPHEVKRAESMGVTFQYGAAPESIEPVGDALVVRMDDGTDERWSSVVVAIGQGPDLEFLDSIGIRIASPEGATNRPGVFVAGGTLYGSDRLKAAILDGRRSAQLALAFTRALA